MQNQKELTNRIGRMGSNGVGEGVRMCLCTFVPLNVLQTIFYADSDFRAAPLAEKVTLWYFVDKQLR